MNDVVLMAVDHHKVHNTLAVINPASRVAVDGGEFADSHGGYRQMMAFARRWRHRRWAVERCHGVGRSLPQRPVAGRESVLYVRAKLALW